MVPELKRGAAAATSSRWNRFRGWLAGLPRQPVVPPTDQFTEPPEGGKIGICCSGGGIRSAAYCLGALQVFVTEGIFARARYISAVSGGSYIAAAHAFVAKWSEADLLDDQPPFARGSPEEAYLRNRSTYIAAGLAQWLGLIGNFLLRTLANLGFIVLVLLVVSRPLSWVALHGLEIGTVHVFGPALTYDSNANLRWHTAPPATLWWILVGAILVMVLVVALRIPDGLQRFLMAWTRRVLAVGALLLVISVVIPAVAFALGTWDVVEVAHRGIKAMIAAGTVVAALGAASTVLLLARKVLPKTALVLAVIAGPVFISFTLCWFVLNGVRVLSVSQAWRGWLGQLLVAAEFWHWFWLLIFTFALYLLLDIGRTSLQPLYKRRLAAAFCLERQRIDGTPAAREIPYGSLTTLSDSRPPTWMDHGGRPQPELIVCAAANVSDADATPPGRRCTSFTFTPREIGGPMAGYLAASEYESRIPKGRARDVTLMSAVAASGAAFSPSMGKMTKSYRFLMALFNLRLGVWLENPRRIVDRSAGRSPWRYVLAFVRRPRMSYLVKEMLGVNRLGDRFLYVTDGGHFENLGLVELLRRGCTEIYCLDASGGSSQFETLAEAVSMARTDLGIEIRIPTEELVVHPETRRAAASHANGTIYFPDGSIGQIVFVQAVLTGNLPLDLDAYALRNLVFPWDPTSDQFFDESQFEAYRKLGECAGKSVVAPLRSADHGDR